MNISEYVPKIEQYPCKHFQFYVFGNTRSLTNTYV